MFFIISVFITSMFFDHVPSVCIIFHDLSQPSKLYRHPKFSIFGSMRAGRAPATLRTAASQRWARRWWGALAVAVQRAISSAVLGVWTMPPLPAAENDVPLAEVLRSQLARRPAGCRCDEALRPTCWPLASRGCHAWDMDCRRAGGKQARENKKSAVATCFMTLVACCFFYHACFSCIFLP